MTTTDLDDRFRPTAQAHARRFDREVVVLDLGGGKYYSLDEVGAVIWEKLTSGLSLGEVVEQIAAAYDVDEETALRDARRITGELVAAGLLERQT